MELATTSTFNENLWEEDIVLMKTEGQRNEEVVAQEDEAASAHILQLTVDSAREDLTDNFYEDMLLPPEVVTIIEGNHDDDDYETEDNNEVTSERDPLISYGVSENRLSTGDDQLIYNEVMRDRMLHCEICGVPFSHRRSLARHMHTHRNTSHQLQKSSELKPGVSSDVTIKINPTGTSFYSINNLEERIGRAGTFRAGSENKRSGIECLVARKRRFLEAVKDRHTFNLDIQCQTFNCEICCSPFANRSTFTQHMKSHGIIVINKYSCSICKKVFSQKPGFDGHITRMHKNLLFNISNEQGESALDRATRIVIEEDHKDDADNKHVTIHTMLAEEDESE